MNKTEERMLKKIKELKELEKQIAELQEEVDDIKAKCKSIFSQFDTQPTLHNVLIAKPSKKTMKTYTTSTQKKPKANDFQFLKKEKKKGKSPSFLYQLYPI